MLERTRSVLVTGGSGLIGNALLRACAERGWRAIGCGRHKPADTNFEWRDYDLAATELPDALFDGVHVIVHAAYVKQRYDANVDGSRLLLERARACGVRQIVFLSSLAAHPAALSQYGKQKYELERTFAAAGALVVRPGLVIGDGGTFGAMAASLRKRRVVPLIAGGMQPLQTVNLDDLIDAMCAAIDRDDAGIFSIAERVPVSYATFCSELAAVMATRVRFVRVPFWLADLTVATAAAIGIALPIDRDNLLGLRAMRADTGPWLDPPGRKTADYRESLQCAARAGLLSSAVKGSVARIG